MVKMEKTQEETNLEEGFDETDEQNINPAITTDDFGSNDFYGIDDFGEGTIPMEKHAELLKQLMDFDPYIKQKFERWVNVYFDEESGEYKTNPYGRPIMNITGASWCVSFIDTYARDNNIITDISQQDYNDIREDLIYLVWPTIFTRQKEFGIKCVADCQRVCLEVLHTALLVLMGSGDGKAAKILTETTHRSESVAYTNPTQYGQQPVSSPPSRHRKRGFFNKLKHVLGG